MKKIFYSMMAVALCACSQSEVDDMPTPPQPENNGLKFTVVDNGFVNEDGTRVTYDGVSYHATFEEGDEIGVFALKSDGITAAWDDGFNPTDAAYTVENVKLTLTGSVWKSETPIDFGDADLLFAYAPYRADAQHKDNKPLFKGSKGNWAISTGNNRFFVHPYTVVDNSGENFELNDWMGAVVNVESGQTEFTFSMQHMRGMVELTTDKDVELEDMMLEVDGNAEWRYHFTPYHIKTDDKNVYRILTTEYRSKNTLYATIKDVDITKKYTKAFSDNSVGAGKCVRVNIGYKPTFITVGNGTTLAQALDGISPAPTTLRLKGSLSDADWATLQGLSLTGLDMTYLNNTSIPANWMANATTLRTTLTRLILPNKLTTIEANALQFPGETETTIELPATVTAVGDQAFLNSFAMKVRIPEDSKLLTIGSYAFFGLRTVYNDPSSTNTLVIPASVTSISAHAFDNMSQLRKVVFQTEKAPVTEDVFGNTAISAIYVPNTTNYKDKGYFTGKTVIAGPYLTVDNYKAVDKDGKSFTSWEGQGLGALCDGPQETYWHSDYDNAHNFDKWGVYIDITLPKAYSNLKLSYTTRWNGPAQVPQSIIIGVATDNGEFIQTNTYETGLKNVDADKNKTQEWPISATSPYNKVRFGVLKSPVGGEATGENKKAYTALSELTVLEETWTDTAPATPAE